MFYKKQCCMGKQLTINEITDIGWKNKKRCVNHFEKSIATRRIQWNIFIRMEDIQLIWNKTKKKVRPQKRSMLLIIVG